MHSKNPPPPPPFAGTLEYDFVTWSCEMTTVRTAGSLARLHSWHLKARMKSAFG
jgi:hypothetical protein